VDQKRGLGFRVWISNFKKDKTGIEGRNKILIVALPYSLLPLHILFSIYPCVLRARLYLLTIINTNITIKLKNSTVCMGARIL